MKIRDASDIYDNRPLIVKASELKNTQTGFEPPFTLGKPKEGTKEGRKVLAMDAAISNVLSGFKDELSYIAMPKFVGYPMLANISQEALIRAGVETIADEMTRKFVEYTYDDDDGEDSEKKDDLITKMEAQAAKYKLVETANKAFVMDGLFGGCLIYIDMGNLTDDEKEEPLIFDRKTFKKGSFRGFKVIEPINCYPGWYNTTDPTSSEYFKPKYWYILGKKYHASRFIYIALNEAPLLLKPAYNFFGIPRAQLALDYVAQFVANRESAQELLNKFSLTCWKTNMAQVLQGASTSDLVKRAKLFNRMKHNSGVMLLDKESEDMVQLNTPLGGVRDIVEMSLNLLTAVWRIPKIKYLGEGESGLNASSKEQMRSFYDFILSQKEKGVTQMMETVLKIFQLNLGLDINEALGFKFPSLVEMDETDRANLNKMQADRDNIYLTNGVLSQEEVRQRLSMDKNSGYSMIDTDEVPEIPEEPLKDDKEVVNNEVDRQTAEDSDLVEDGIVDWITTKTGIKVPIQDGQTKKNAIKSFFEKLKSYVKKDKNTKEKEDILQKAMKNVGGFEYKIPEKSDDDVIETISNGVEVRYNNKNGMGAFEKLKDGKTILKISPDKYSRLTPKISKEKSDIEETVSKISENIRSGSPVAMPSLEVKISDKLKNTLEVISHEGRHRSLALKSLGVKNIPVVLIGDVPENIYGWDIVSQDGRDKIKIDS